MSGIQTKRGQEGFVTPLAGFTADQSTDLLEYVTAQNVGGRKRALDVVTYGTYAVSTGNLVATGSTTRKIIKATHGAKANDVLQFTSGNNSGVSIQILSVPDANTMILAATPEGATAIGDTFTIRRYVTPEYDSSGAISVTTIQTPIKYNLNGVETEVGRDTGTPSNSRPLPVEIMSASGVDINITAGDINVSLTDTGANYDSVRIGDGTTLAGVVPVTNELKTHDGDLLTELRLKADLTETQPVLSKATATVAAPSYVEGSDNSLSQDLTGRLRVTALGASASNADAHPASATGHVPTLAHLLGFNGTTYDRLRSTIAGGLLVEFSNTAITANAGTNLNTSALALESGGNLATIKTNTDKIPSLGQALEAASVPVVLTAAQISTLTPLSSVTVTQATGTNLHTVVDSGAVTATPATISGTVTQANITVGTSAVRATVAGTAPNAARKKLLISPLKTNTGAIYLGASSVTTANGLEIIGPDRMSFELDASDYYLISDTAGQSVRVVEVA